MKQPGAIQTPANGECERGGNLAPTDRLDRLGSDSPPDNFSTQLSNSETRTRPRVGLALSGGAAKGLAHVGVIQVLEENGIHIDAVAGSSMGAYVGSIWCSGHDGLELERIAREVRGRRGLWRLMDPMLPPRRGFIRGRAMRKRLARSIGRMTFAEMERPFRAVTTCLESLDRVVFSEGEVAPAVQASCAIPGICEPVRIGEGLYTDGAVVEPVPVRSVREMGVDRVIAVSVFPTPEFQKLVTAHDRRQATKARRRHRWLACLNRQVNWFASGNILDTVYRSLGAAQLRLAARACRRADVVIRPLSLDARWFEFHHPEKYIALGRAAAEAQLDQLQALVDDRAGRNGKEATHEEHTFANAS
jgi:NTE family protein